MNQDHSIHSKFSASTMRYSPLPPARSVADCWAMARTGGRHGGLTYMERNLDKRIDPALLVEGARSVVVCAISYNRPPAAGVASRIASYARGRDYHPVLKEKLHELLAYIRDLHPGTSGRVFVDTAPILEKSWAAEAGVGRIGRHSLLIVPGLGSFVVLGLIVMMPNSNPIRLSWHRTRAVPAAPVSKPAPSVRSETTGRSTLRFVSRAARSRRKRATKATCTGGYSAATFASWPAPTTAMHRYPPIPASPRPEISDR